MYQYFQKLLDERGVTAADVCRATGIKSGTISTWKKRDSLLSVDYLYKIAMYFGVLIEYFLGKTDSSGRIEIRVHSEIDEIYESLDEVDKEKLKAFSQGLLASEKYKKNMDMGGEVG